MQGRRHLGSRRIHRTALRAGMRFGFSIILSLVAACAAPRPPLVVSDPDPSVKIPAMEKAVRQRDLGAVPQLIKDLASDDAAVRLFANHALEELTGQRFGFEYFAGEDKREEAVKRWQQWLAQRSDNGITEPPTVNASTLP